MPNLNKLRGGKVGGGPRAGAGQMGAAAKYHHNSESRLQQPPSRMQGRDLQCSAVTSRCVLMFLSSKFKQTQHCSSSARPPSPRVELGAAEAGLRVWAAASRRRGRAEAEQRHRAAPGAAQARLQAAAAGVLPPVSLQLPRLLGIVMTGSCVPGRDCRCEERRVEAAPRPRTPGAVTRPGWRTATDPGPPSGTRQPPHPAPLDLRTARTCPDTRPTWPRVSEARAPPTISACSLSTISGNNPLSCPAWTRTRTIE